MNKIKFVMVLHNHQPCDNFGWVFEDAYRKSYKPFIDTLEKYPDVKIVMHYSGSLLEWLKENKPDFLLRIKTLLETGQIEILTGGFYEPIFSMIPENDRKAQVGLLTDFIKENFGYQPKGAWITERVWDEGIPDLFQRQGIKYTVIDEHHLKQAGIKGDEISGCYETNNGFKVFASSRKLRYALPFAKVRSTIEYFKNLHGKEDCIVFADDGEKFGFWPHTYKWVYDKGWLNSLFRYLSTSPIVRTCTFSDIASDINPICKVSIPQTSYCEMMDWAQGNFKNFFKIYPEANIMRNRMLTVSEDIEKIDARHLADENQKSMHKEACIELYKAQSGCAYWHGIFGGLYINHLRQGVYKHLINAQKKLETLSKYKGIYLRMHDFDNDDKEEVILGNRFFDLYIKPDNAGSIFGFDNKVKSYNMVNTITRKRESYHSKLFGKKRTSLNDVKSDIENNKYIDIHDVLGINGRNLKKYLIYDDAKKDSILEYIIKEEPDFRNARFNERGNFIKLQRAPSRVDKIIDRDYASLMLEKEEVLYFDGIKQRIYISKELTVLNAPEIYVEYAIRNLSGDKFSATFAIEYNWSFMNRQFLKRRHFKAVNSFTFDDEWSGIKLKYYFNDPVSIWTMPVYTVNETEMGLGKTYQYISFLILNRVSLEKGLSKKISNTVTIG